MIGDEKNQAALTEAWKTLTERLAKLADEIEQKQQAVCRSRSILID